MNKFLVFIFLTMLVGCKAKTVYVPLESIKQVYHERVLRDSIHLHDSVLVKIKNDTVFFEKYGSITN